MTGISRRGVIGAGAFGVALAPLTQGTEADAATTRNLYARSRFKPLIRKKFRLTGATSSTTVRLVRITNLPSATPGDNRRFALTFRSRTAGPHQGSYTLRRKGFKATKLFVVPSDARRRTFEAVINRAP